MQGDRLILGGALAALVLCGAAYGCAGKSMGGDDSGASNRREGMSPCRGCDGNPGASQGDAAYYRAGSQSDGAYIEGYQHGDGTGPTWGGGDGTGIVPDPSVGAFDQGVGYDDGVPSDIGDGVPSDGWPGEGAPSDGQPGDG